MSKLGGIKMKYCSNCGKEIMDEAKFCDGCGASIEILNTQLENENITPESVIATQEEATINSGNMIIKSKKSKIGKLLAIIIPAAVISLMIVVISIVNGFKLNKYETTLVETYNTMVQGAEQAESYASLESKVWRNCIMQSASTETDKYTKNEYGNYFSDFNDALQKFHTGEYLTYSEVSANVDVVNNYMAELKDCPDKFEEEYRALKEMYVAYSDLTDLVVGDSSYSCNSFSDALEAAKSNYKTAKSAASLMIG